MPSEATIERVKLDDLKIPTEYHQGVNPSAVRLMAEQWAASLYAPITVSVRENGDTVIVDGVQRVEALKRRGHADTVEARVFRGLTREQEVMQFVVANTRMER